MKLILILILTLFLNYSNSSILYSVSSNSNYLNEAQNIFTLDVESNTVQSNYSLRLPYKIIGIANVEEVSLINLICLDKPNKKSYLIQVNLENGNFNEIGGVVIDNVFLQDDWINSTSNYLYANEKLYQVGTNVNDLNESNFILVVWDFQSGLQSIINLNSIATSWASGDNSYSLAFDYINNILFITYQTTLQDQSILALDFSTTNSNNNIPISSIVYPDIGNLQIDPNNNLLYSTGILIDKETTYNSGIYQIIPDYNSLEICQVNIEQLVCNTSNIEPSMGDSNYNNGGYQPFFLSNDKKSVIILPISDYNNQQQQQLDVIVYNLQFSQVLSNSTITNYWYNLSTNLETFTFLTYQ